MSNETDESKRVAYRDGFNEGYKKGYEKGFEEGVLKKPNARTRAYRCSS